MTKVKTAVVFWLEGRAKSRNEKQKKRQAAHRAKLQQAWKAKVEAARGKITTA